MSVAEQVTVGHLRAVDAYRRGMREGLGIARRTMEFSCVPADGRRRGSGEEGGLPSKHKRYDARPDPIFLFCFVTPFFVLAKNRQGYA